MKIAEQKIIDLFFEVSNNDDIQTRANLIGIGEVRKLRKSGSEVVIQINGVPELTVDQLSKVQITILTTWMNTKITFIHNLHKHYFTDELKDLKPIRLEGCYHSVDIAVITFDNEPSSYEACIQNLCLCNTLRSIGFGSGSGQQARNIYLINYNPHYYALSQWKRRWVNIWLEMRWNADKPYKWAL